MIRNGSKQRRLCGALTTFSLCLLTIAAGPARAQVSGVSYKLTPAVENIWFSDDAALKNSPLFGGQLGFGFGRYIEVNGVYFVGTGFATDFSKFTIGNPTADPLFASIPSRDVRISRYGGALKFNLGHGNIFPYAAFGTGVLAFEPDGLNRSETVYMTGTAGLQIGIKDRYTLILQASSLNYRYNPASTLLSSDDLTTLGLTADDFELRRVSSWSAAAGLQFYLGGKSDGSMTDVDRALKRQLSSGWRGVGLRVEPLAGQINFSRSLGYRENQRILGVAAGIDLGRYAGLRGFYWRGTDDKTWTEFDELSAWGGEMQLAFESSAGITPFLTLGGGFMKAGGDYVGNGAAPVDDRPFGLAGFGLVIPLGSTVNLVGTARSLMMSTSGADNVSDPGTVKSNLMVSATLGFSLGGGGGETAGEMFGREFESSRAERERLKTRLDAAEARIDSLAQVMPGPGQRPIQTPLKEAAPEGAVSAKPAAGEKEKEAAKPAVVAPPAAAVTPPATPADQQERWITVPVPREGELYLRFGKPGGVTMETVDGDALQYFYDPVTGEIITRTAGTAAAPKLAAGTRPAPAAPATQAPARSDTAAARVSGLTSAQFESMMRKAMQDESTRQQARRDSTDAMIRRLQASLDSRITAMDSKMEQQRVDFGRQLAETQRVAAQSAATPPPTSQPASQPAAKPAPEARRPESRKTEMPEARPQEAERAEETSTADLTPRQSRGSFQALRPMIGYNIDRPHQFLMGVRADYVLRGKPVRISPEYILGVGDGDATNSFNVNAFYDVLAGERNRPYVGAGVGLISRSDTEFVFNLLAGAERRLDFGTAYLEFVTQDFFDNNRLFLGMRLGF